MNYLWITAWLPLQIFQHFHDYWNKHFCLFTVICVDLPTSWAALPKLNWSNKNFSSFSFPFCCCFQGIYFVIKVDDSFFFFFFLISSGCFWSDSLVTQGINALSPSNRNSENGTGKFIYFKIANFIILQTHLIKNHFFMENFVKHFSCLGKWSHHVWRCSRKSWIWHLVPQVGLSQGLGSIILEVNSNPNDSVINRFSLGEWQCVC